MRAVILQQRPALPLASFLLALWSLYSLSMARVVRFWDTVPARIFLKVTHIFWLHTGRTLPSVNVRATTAGNGSVGASDEGTNPPLRRT